MNNFSHAAKGLFLAALMTSTSANPKFEKWDYLAIGGVVGGAACFAFAYRLAQDIKNKKARMDKVSEREQEKLKQEIEHSQEWIDWLKMGALPVATAPMIAWGMNLKGRMQPALVLSDRVTKLADDKMGKDKLSDLLDKLQGKSLDDQKKVIKDNSAEFAQLSKIIVDAAGINLGGSGGGAGSETEKFLMAALQDRAFMTALNSENPNTVDALVKVIAKQMKCSEADVRRELGI